MFSGGIEKFTQGCNGLNKYGIFYLDIGSSFKRIAFMAGFLWHVKDLIHNLI